MGLGDEYDVGVVDTQDTDAYQEAVQDGAAAMGLDDAHAAWRGVTAGLEDDVTAYAAALGYIDTMDYDMDAVYSFCADTPLTGRDGLFVSAVVDRAPESVVRLPDLSGVDQVGYRAVKTLHVAGDTGDLCGQELASGSITVQGDVGPYCGQEMQAGSIEVYGDATGEDDPGFYHGSYLGAAMEDGRITVHGDGGDRVGKEMQDGAIHVHGDTGSHVGCGMEDGTITVDGYASHNIGQAMEGGRVRIGRTSYRVGRGMQGGTLIIKQSRKDEWPPLPTDASGGEIRYGTGAEQEQVWPPISIYGRVRHAARIGGEMLSDTLVGV